MAGHGVGTPFSAGTDENHFCERLVTRRGSGGVFLLGRHALKRYVRVRESSKNAMCGRAWAETLLDKIYTWRSVQNGN